MSYTNGLDNPELYFQTKLYSGSGGNSHAITFDGSENMQPDWVWIKARNSNSHRLTDSVRGATKILYSDLDYAEVTDADTIQSFDTDGFTIDDDADTNGSGINFASWNWKAGGSASSNSDGSITSSVSANTTAGFSIGTYNGSGSDNTVGHGLGVAPDMIIVKCKSTAHDWVVYHSALGNAKILTLNATNAAQNANGWQYTSPSSTVFSIDNAANSLNQSGQSFVFYAFAEKKGYSKFGSFTGNASTDGPFLHTGFKPAYFLIKNTSDGSANWQVWDNKREYAFNEVQAHLYPNTSGAEVINTGYNNCDFLSNGIKVTEDNGDFNGSGNTVIWMAFAESPFVNSNGVPNNAR